MKKIFSKMKRTLPLVGMVLLSTQAMSQLSITGQYRTRTEFRDGQGTLPVEGAVPTFFTSSRTRLNVGLTADKFKFFTAIQDVRVWGQDASTISNMDGSRLYLHEAWGEVQLNDSTYFKKFSYLGFKVGRQTIAYDDQRLLGGLDWLQQGRRHDAIILKAAIRSWKLDVGAAYNQQREYKNAGTIYYGTPTTQLGTDGANIAAGAGTNGIGIMYKAMQFAYLTKDIGYSKIAGLFFNDIFQRNNAGGVPDRGVWNRMTVGATFYGQIKHKIDAGFYYQGNRDKVGKTMDGYMATLSTQFQIGRKFTAGPGVDYLSGNSTLDSTSKVNRAFDPLYGTPHKFWGFMDYFYVADPTAQATGGVSRNPGLLNIYLNTTYKFRDNLILSFAAHQFFAGNKVANKKTADLTDEMDRNLGTELDFVLNYNLTKTVGFELGYSVMFATNTMEALKSTVSNRELTGQWAYFTINIRPDFTQVLNTTLRDLKKGLDDSNKEIQLLKQPVTN
jgi:hypothetical protein